MALNEKVVSTMPHWIPEPRRRVRRASGERKMKPVIVHRTKPGEHECAVGITGRPLAIAQKAVQIKSLSLHKHSVDPGGVGKAQVTAIGREHHDVGIGIDGPGSGLEPAMEEFVEGAK